MCEIGLLMAIEEEFDIEISDADVERMEKVKDVIAYLEKRLGS